MNELAIYEGFNHRRRAWLEPLSLEAGNLIPIAEYAEREFISVSTAKRRIKRREIRGRKFGNNWFVLV